MKNVVADAAGHIYVCGENITGEDFTVVPGMGEVRRMKDATLKDCRDVFPAGSHGWQFFQILRDNLTLKRARQKSLAVVGIAACIISTVWGGMMGDLPQATAQPAFYLNPLPPTFSLYSEKGMLLYAGIGNVVFGKSGDKKGLYFVLEGQRKFLVLRDHEAVLIKPDPDPRPVYHGKIGPRK